MTDPRRRLLEELTENAAQVAALEQEHARVVDAADTSNSDDEHDPEGATLAFEREQLVALTDQAQRTRAELEHAIGRLEAGTYGTCESCGSPIDPARLDARPQARTCITCAP